MCIRDRAATVPQECLEAPASASPVVASRARAPSIGSTPGTSPALFSGYMSQLCPARARGPFDLHPSPR
eukprot:3078645-Pyramimonas_sp.AAC.1